MGVRRERQCGEKEEGEKTTHTTNRRSKIRAGRPASDSTWSKAGHFQFITPLDRRRSCSKIRGLVMIIQQFGINN